MDPIIIVIAYIITGVAITGYEFSAPLIHRKMYVMHRNYKAAVATWFIWPITILVDTYYSLKEKKAGLRYFAGVASLFAATLLAGAWLNELMARSVGSALSYLLCVVALVLVSPIFAAITLPRHERV